MPSCRETAAPSMAAAVWFRRACVASSSFRPRALHRLDGAAEQFRHYFGQTAALIGQSGDFGFAVFGGLQPGAHARPWVPGQAAHGGLGAAGGGARRLGGGRDLALGGSSLRDDTGQARAGAFDIGQGFGPWRRLEGAQQAGAGEHKGGSSGHTACQQGLRRRRLRQA